jgi:hypothetical protein
MDMNSELGTELRNLVGLANTNGLYKASDWLMRQLALQSDVSDGQPAAPPIIKDFQKGDACDICEDGMITACAKGTQMTIGGHACHGYCLNCGQRYNYPE